MISYSVINKRLANILNKFGFCITTDLNFIYLQDYYVISSVEKEMQKIIKTLAVIQAKQTTGELKTRIKRITDHLQQTQQEFTEVENILKSEKE